MFVGIDHGTTSMRFATSEGHIFKMSRQDAANMTESELLHNILEGLGANKNNIQKIAITYSMGDAISKITPIERVPNRGIISREGAGLQVGGGTQVFDAIKGSGIPTIVIPGLHRGNTLDERFNIFSHGASPEKIGIVYFAFKQGYNDLIVSDISSNTVTLAVADGHLVGGIDACIFAPGIHHGPLDLAAIRDVDAGLYNANEAFTQTGVIKMTGHGNIHELIDAFESGDEQAALAFDTLALFASMEIVSMKLLFKEKGDTEPRIFLSGSVSELQYVKDKISKHVDSEVESIGEWSAARGCALIAKDVYNGEKDILGIKVD